MKYTKEWIVQLESDLKTAITKMIHYRRLYEGQKATAEHTALWLEGYRRLVREQGFRTDDLDRLLEILDEIEMEAKQ